MKSKLLGLALGATMLAGTPASAAVVTYSGGDNNVSSLAQMTNSVAARARFDAAVSGGTTVTFEGALPAGLTITGGNTTSESGCGALCGFNTSPAGTNFRSLVGGTAVFTFANPVNAFGFYITGLQTDQVPQQTVTFSDGSAQTINFPTATGGGGAFVGFTDFGRTISSVTVNVTQDIAAIDDVRFACVSAAVPEPATWALMIGGFGVVGGAMRRRPATRVRFA